VAAGIWSRTWHLVDEAGTVVLEIRPRGAFPRAEVLRVLQPMEVDLLVFAYYVVNARWNEQAAAS
jgi:hypothetical protein